MSHNQRRASMRRAIEEPRMYNALVFTFAALTIFVPAFIGLRARTNADWRAHS